ncbi:uncharacterized protein LOC114355344 [Ostrinia furnacalis]|uniref:uncharacterized protein LOC114355344 n=1 Tax=Ostrinia furnacalis TaxID=93504 RepID=UPI00103E21EF|nr:uncharacterized protein LOC114355344 [Ostrinia furnacalis]
MAPTNDRTSHHDVVSTSEIYPNSSSSFETTSNPPGSHESFSIFGDSACGEPLSPQHLMLDFTPIEEIDNDFVQRKCCAFWDFLNSRTDLHSLMVMPEKNLYDLALNSEPSLRKECTGLMEERASFLGKEKTAVSMLEFVEEKGLIDRTFEAKLPQSMCSLGSREYRENEASARFKPTAHKKEMCKCSGDCRCCPSQAPAASPEVLLMCSKMSEWDKKHPKSMEPPGHPPALSRCVMQRKVTT